MAAVEIRMIIANIVNIIIVLVLITASIYIAMLFIKLARKGIKALDIYINGKRS